MCLPSSGWISEGNELSRRAQRAGASRSEWAASSGAPDGPASRTRLAVEGTRTGADNSPRSERHECRTRTAAPRRQEVSRPWRTSLGRVCAKRRMGTARRGAPTVALKLKRQLEVDQRQAWLPRFCRIGSGCRGREALLPAWQRSVRQRRGPSALRPLARHRRARARLGHRAPGAGVPLSLGRPAGSSRQGTSDRKRSVTRAAASQSSAPTSRVRACVVLSASARRACAVDRCDSCGLEFDGMSTRCVVAVMGWSILAVAALARHSSGPAQQDSAAGTAAASVVSVQARSGVWTQHALDGLGSTPFQTLNAIAIRIERAAPLPTLDPQRFEFRLGADEWLAAVIARADGELLTVELGQGARLELSIDDVLSIAAPARMAAFERPVPAERGDRLYWLRPKGVDRVDGSFQSFAAAGVVFESALGVRTFPWSEVGALAIEPLGVRPPPRPSPQSVTVDLASGGRLHGELLGVGEGLVRLRWRGQAELALACDVVDQIVLDDGSVAHLGAFRPTRINEGVAEGDESGMRWPYQIDRSVMGGSLRAGGRVFSRGVGVHAPSRLEWELDGTWQSLLGAVAIDDSVELLAYRGSVRCAIYLDDAAEPAWRSGRIEGATPPTLIGDLQLSGVRRIALEVDMDERLYVADRLNWIELRLVK